MLSLNVQEQKKVEEVLTFLLEFDFETPQIGDNDLLMKMRNFLGQDESQPDILEKRGLYLNKLRTEWLEKAGNE